jgi:hypothetical protein
MATKALHADATLTTGDAGLVTLDGAVLPLADEPHPLTWPSEWRTAKASAFDAMLTTGTVSSSGLPHVTTAHVSAGGHATMAPSEKAGLVTWAGEKPRR